MNVFILCTGRCGSTTIIKACQHISNFSSAHESRAHLLGDDRFNYPPNHIEADNRLSWLLGRLGRRYGKDAVYVHLKRNLRDTADSFVNGAGAGIFKAYKGSGIIMGSRKGIAPMAIALDYCDTVTSNIEMYLQDKPNKLEFNLEKAKQDFPTFCELIGAEANMGKALAEFDVRYNTSKRIRA